VARPGSVLSLGLGLAYALAGAACGGPTDVGGQPIKTTIIGPEGGQASSVTGLLKLQIPPGGLETPLAITVQQIDPPGAGVVGQAFELGPSGTVFKQPVTLVVRYSESDLGINLPDNLQVATYLHGAWQPVPSMVNAGVGMVSAQIDHFSPWSLVMMP
jgi:hypothetical protein